MSDTPTSPDDKFIITREGLDNFNGWIIEAGRRKKILLDLIAELKDIYYHPYEDTYHPKNDLGIAIGNAEERLKGLSSE